MNEIETMLNSLVGVTLTQEQVERIVELVGEYGGERYDSGCVMINYYNAVAL